MNNTPTTLNDRMNALKNRATQQAGEIWQPVAGETLVGVIAGSEAVAHPLYGNQYQMLIHDENGAIVKVWLSKYLRDNLRAQNADQNDLIALTFGGKRKNAQGREFNAYTVVIEKA
jgi:hypothetical protein